MNNKQNKNRPRTKRVRKRRNGRTNGTMASNMSATQARRFISGKCSIVRGPVPDGTLVDLFYIDTTFSRNNVGGTVLSWRYRMNSAYDPDPLLGTGALTGFLEWAAFYTHYRVVDFGYDIQLANMETFPLLVVCCPSATDLGANYTYTDQIPEFPYGRKNILSAKTGDDKCRFRGSVDISKFEGTTESIYDSTFASAVTANPSNVRYFNVGAGSSAVFANGIFLSVRLRTKCGMNSTPNTIQ